MTVAKGIRGSFAGDGTATIFVTTFHATSSADLGVVLEDDTTLIKTAQVLGTDFTVSDLPGIVTITTITAPAVGETLRVYPVAPYTQATDFDNANTLFGSSIEAAQDHLVGSQLGINDQLGQGIRAPADDPVMGVLVDARLRLDKILQFNSVTGQPEMLDKSVFQAELNALSAELAAIAALSPLNDDVIQRKAGAWVNRTMTELMVDAGVALPDAMAFSADLDTGWDRSAANTIQEKTAGVVARQVDANGIQTLPLIPSFLARQVVDNPNVTGNGTAYTVIFDTEVHDRNADYAIASGIFTAPVTGLYDFSAGLNLLALGSATSILLELVTSNRTYRLAYMAGANDVSNEQAVGGSVFCVDMDAADTATLLLTVSGTGSDAVDIDGHTSATSFFSGSLRG